MSMCDRTPSYRISALLIRLILVPACGIWVAMVTSCAQSGPTTSNKVHCIGSNAVTLDLRQFQVMRLCMGQHHDT